MIPSVGSIVHYVSEGTPVRADGTQKYPSKCVAATVTEVGDDHTVGLFVMNPSGTFHHPLALGGAVFDDDDDPAQRQGGSWHWPERA